MGEIEQGCLAASRSYVENSGSLQGEGRKMVLLPFTPFTKDNMEVLRMKFDCISANFQIIILWAGLHQRPVPCHEHSLYELLRKDCTVCDQQEECAFPRQ